MSLNQQEAGKRTNKTWLYLTRGWGNLCLPNRGEVRRGAGSSPGLLWGPEYLRWLNPPVTAFFSLKKKAWCCCCGDYQDSCEYPQVRKWKFLVWMVQGSVLSDNTSTASASKGRLRVLVLLAKKLWVKRVSVLSLSLEAKLDWRLPCVFCWCLNNTVHIGKFFERLLTIKINYWFVYQI